MMKVSILLVILTGACIGLVGCGGASSPAQAPSQAAAQPNPEATPSSDEAMAARPKLTAQACEASGGAVVGDIGDGAIHRPEFRCPNGAKPIASVGAVEGEPIAVEGAVCCPR
jgi:hypothetical protein